MDYRYKTEHSPSVIDLFSGVGGLSLGAARAGFDVRLAVEIDPIAAASHAFNFPKSKHLQQDVGTLTGEKILERAGIKMGQLDGLVGGPPCQGFSAIGKSDPGDPRNKLFGQFFRLASETRPKFFIAENVPGILAARNESIINAAFELIPNNYIIKTFVIKASDYGVPTTRTRVFFIGLDSKRMRIDLELQDLLPLYDFKVNVGHALQGLPSIRSNWVKEEQGWRKRKDIPNDQFFERVSNSRPYDIGDPAAINRHDMYNQISGCLGTIHEPETIRRFSLLNPGDTDHISRSKKLDPLGFCPTLRAGTASDRGSFQAVRPIHPKAPRVITPREAARLQGFPDWFVFHPTKWHAFRQIGNSVSPIVAESILSAVKQKLH